VIVLSDFARPAAPGQELQKILTPAARIADSAAHAAKGESRPAADIQAADDPRDSS
jgi:hypothetical protein